MNYRDVKNWITGMVIALALAAVVTMALPAQARVGANASIPNFGADYKYANPNAYLYGSLSGGNVFSYQGGNDVERTFTRVVMQPSHTPLVYTQAILFCGDVSALFKGKRGALILTYERVAHESFFMEGCHTLKSVDVVGGK